MKNIYAIVISAIALFAFGQGSQINAKAPDAPALFSAAYDYTEHSITFKTAIKDNQTRPDGFHVYMLKDGDGKPSLFHKFEADKNSNEFKSETQAPGPGVYIFYATSVIYVNGQIVESKPSGKVHLRIGDNNTKEYVEIYSKPPGHALQNHPFQYKALAKSNVKCPILFSLLHAPDGMKIDSKTGVIEWMPEKTGYYEVAVKAYLECDKEIHDIQKFTLRVIVKEEAPIVEIISKPTVEAKVGALYKYQVKVKSNINCPPHFELSYAPDGMIINSKTGLIEWKPQKEGVYKVQVLAIVECNGITRRVEQHFAIKVSGQGDTPRPCAYIAGEVYDKHHDGLIQDGFVQAILADKHFKDKNSSRVFTAKIKDSRYELFVPEGKYLVFANVPGYKILWHENAPTPENAKIIPVECNHRFEINFALESMPKPNMVPVSGRVVSARTGEPAPAVIHFFPKEILLENYKGKPTPDKGFMARTDEKGYYKIELPDIFEYIAQASAIPVNDINKPMYKPQFYSGVYTPFEADILVLKKPLEDINFKLEEIKHTKGNIYGMVVNADKEPVKARVIAHLMPNIKDLKIFAQIAETDDRGMFKFEGLIPGKYALISIPADREYLPGYYKMGDFVVRRWKEATIIAVGPNMPDVLFEIKHPRRSDLPGIINIKGVVASQQGGIIGKNSGGVPQGSSEIAGAFVYAIGQDGDIIDYTFSNSSGQFELTEVTPEAEFLVADKIGFETIEEPIDVNYEDKKSNVINLSLQLDNSTAVEDEVAAALGALVYPTPAADYVNVKLFKEGQFTISLFDITGAALYSREIESGGETAIRIDCSKYPSGAYYININNAEKRISVPLIINR